MTFLFIMLGMSALFSLLLLCPVCVRVFFNQKDGFSGKVRYLFFSYSFPPKPQKKESAEKRKKEAEPDHIGKMKGIIKEKGLPGFLNFLRELAEIAAGAAKKLFSHLVICDISVRAVVASGDAAETALVYGSICSVVYPAFGVLVSNTKCKRYNISLTPDFDRKELSVDFFVQARIRLCFLASAALGALLRYIKFSWKEKKKKPAGTQAQKES
ncbi:conserved membrane protein of unknown function [Ruminococcaceae bacterium BL-6]|nr:conserved membrane protein of unknown function [Ruminococcaceae bacterium BL-6]